MTSNENKEEQKNAEAQVENTQQGDQSAEELELPENTQTVEDAEVAQDDSETKYAELEKKYETLRND